MGKPLRYPRDALPNRIRPYRALPHDFRQRYVELGWENIQEHYRTNWRVIARWIDEAGGDELRCARRAWVAEHGMVKLHVSPLEKFA
jgi:hypothetical protein